MESLPVMRKSCLLRLRENCPFRKLRRQTYALSAVTPAPIGSYWNNISPPISHQPISMVCSQPLPHLTSVSPSNQSEVAADVHMEEDPPAAENQNPNPENRAEDCMELDDDIDPETGERAQG